MSADQIFNILAEVRSYAEEKGQDELEVAAENVENIAMGEVLGGQFTAVLTPCFKVWCKRLPKTYRARTLTGTID